MLEKFRIDWKKIADRDGWKTSFPHMAQELMARQKDFIISQMSPEHLAVLPVKDTLQAYAADLSLPRSALMTTFRGIRLPRLAFRVHLLMILFTRPFEQLRDHYLPRQAAARSRTVNGGKDC